MIISELNVSDGHVVAFKILSDRAIVLISDWQETIYAITFEGVVGVEAYSPERTDLCNIEISTQSKRIREACYVADADETNIIEYSFISAWTNIAILRIFSENVEMHKADESTD